MDKIKLGTFQFCGSCFIFSTAIQNIPNDFSLFYWKLPIRKTTFEMSYALNLALKYFAVDSIINFLCSTWIPNGIWFLTEWFLFLITWNSVWTINGLFAVLHMDQPYENCMFYISSIVESNVGLLALFNYVDLKKFCSQNGK